MDSFEFNKIAGWVLTAAIVILGGATATSYIYHPHKLEKPGYVVEGVEADAAAGPVSVEKPIAFYLATASAEKGAEVFKKCATCHVIENNGQNGIGPNLYGVIGKPHAHMAGFGYSEVMQGTHGKPWTFDEINEWLKSPKAYMPGNKMSFAGLSKPEDRAAVIAYLNTQSAAPLPLPPVPKEAAAAPADAKTAGAATPTSEKAAPAPGKAPDVPVADVKTAAKQPQSNIGGPGAAEVTGTTKRENPAVDKAAAK